MHVLIGLKSWDRKIDVVLKASRAVVIRWFSLNEAPLVFLKFISDYLPIKYIFQYHSKTSVLSLCRSPFILLWRNLIPSIHVDASYHVLVHLARQFQRRRLFRYRPIRNKNCLWWPCLLTDRDEAIFIEDLP